MPAIKHVHTSCFQCLCCGELVQEEEDDDYGQAVMVTVELGSQGFASTYDCVLALCEGCQEAGLADVELLNVRALGRALMLAAECAATKRKARESQSQAAEREEARRVRPPRHH